MSEVHPVSRPNWLCSVRLHRWRRISETHYRVCRRCLLLQEETLVVMPHVIQMRAWLKGGRPIDYVPEPDRALLVAAMQHRGLEA
jgi:hypothetical protein